MVRTGETKSDWGCVLPRDILELILSNLRLMKDLNGFRAVCREWRCAAKDYAFGTSQWLIKKNGDEPDIHLFHPLADTTSVHIPEELVDTTLVCAKHGWLLMITMNGTDNNDYGRMLFLNPFTKSIVELPAIPNRVRYLDDTRFTFTSSPISTDCLVVGVFTDYRCDRFIVLTLSHGENHWRRKTFFFYHCWKPSSQNPVYCNGKLYCLCGSGAKLFAFDPSTRRGALLEPANAKELSSSRIIYLLEFDGELAAVVTSYRNLWKVSVYKWDESGMMWHEVDGIGEYMFFLSDQESFAKKCTKEYMKNKLYFPRLHQGYVVFYCLKDRRFRTFGDDHFDRADLDDTECLNGKGRCSKRGGCWMEPIQHDDTSLIEWCEIDAVGIP